MTFFMALAVAFLWLGCTVTEQNYRFLSTFFDGVPDPALLAGVPGGAVVRGEKVYFQHKPYADEACDDCHRGARGVMLFTSRSDSSVCLKCHGGVPTEHPRMHGPVAAVACLWCHQPHQSTTRPLLRTSSTELCMQCHGLHLMDAPQAPEHSDLERDCLECHHGHGGVDPYFLRSLMEIQEPDSTEAEADEAEGGTESESGGPGGATNDGSEEEGPDHGGP